MDGWMNCFVELPCMIQFAVAEASPVSLRKEKHKMFRDCTELITCNHNMPTCACNNNVVILCRHVKASHTGNVAACTECKN